MKINVSEKPSEKYVFFSGIKNILQLAEKNITRNQHTQYTKKITIYIYSRIN